MDKHMRDEALIYIWTIVLIFIWPVAHIIMYIVRFDSMPQQSGLVFLPMGIVSGYILMHFVRRAHTLRQKYATIAGYLLTTPFALIGSLLGGLLAPPLLGANVFGVLPLALGILVGYFLVK